MVAWVAPRRGDDPFERIVTDHELGIAPVERLPLARAGITYGAAPSCPRVVRDRALVYVAYRSAPDGTLGVVRFYVSVAGLDDARRWSALARAIATTLDVRADPSVF
jgi:hypothetical protein